MENGSHINEDQPTKRFRFLELPAELRCYIYELCLVVPQRERACDPPSTEEEAIEGDAKSRSRNRKVAMTMSEKSEVWLLQHPPLLAVSREIR